MGSLLKQSGPLHVWNLGQLVESLGSCWVLLQPGESLRWGRAGSSNMFSMGSSYQSCLIRPALLIPAKVCLLLADSSLFSPGAFSYKEKVIGTHCSQDSLYISSGSLWNVHCNMKTLKAGGDVFIFAGHSWNIGPQCSTSSFKVISQADMNVITQCREVP